MQGRQGAGRVQGQGTEGRAGLQDSILRFSRPENLKITFLQLFEKKGEGRAGQILGSERLGAGQHRGAARVQGQGKEGRAGLQDSILRFSRPENLKITFLQLFEKKGEGRAGQILGSERLGAGPRPGLREGQGAGQAGRRQGAGAGYRGQGRVARFHFEVFKAENLKITFLQLFEKKGEGRGRAAQGRPRPWLREGQGAGQAGRRQGAGAGHRGQGRVARFHFEVFKA